MRMVLVAGMLMLALFVALISSVNARCPGGAPTVAHTQEAGEAGFAG